jgi:GAF domain-containing protein
MVTHKQARSWSRDERQLVKAVAQQVGIVLRQWQLQQQLDGRERLLEQLPTFVRSLQETNSVTDLYALAAEYLVQLLEVPLAGLLTWRESDTSSAAYLRSTSSRHEAFALSSSSQQPISLECDGLLQQCLQAATVPLPLELDALPAETRAWLDAPELAQLLAIASPAPSPDGEAILLFVGADRERCWLPTDGHVLQLWQLAVGHSLNTLLEKQRREQRLAELTELNWCKHRLLTTLQSSLTIGQNRLHQIVQAAQVEAAASPNETHWHKVNKIGHSLSELAADIAPIESEYLQPQPALSTVSVATLIRQTLRHLEAVVQQQKLWPRVHGETKGFVRAEPLRLELVLLELMTFAALRSPNGGRIDVWHQTSIDASAISIVDEGAPLSLSLLDGLAATATGAAVMPSLFQGEPLLQESPGRELNLCQKLVYRMGGTLAFYRSEDNRNVTQLTLPLVPQPESKNSA